MSIAPPTAKTASPAAPSRSSPNRTIKKPDTGPASSAPTPWAVITTPRNAVGRAQFLFGLGIGIDSPNELGYRQAVTPDRLQGRMNATIRSLNWGMIAIGAPLGGVLADWLGYRPALWIPVVGLAVAAYALTRSGFRHARIPDLPNER